MIKKLSRGTGYLVQESEHDTTNIICRHGHIYADGGFLVASLDCATIGQSRVLRKLGTTIMDGDCGELSVKVDPSKFRDICRILKPRQSSNQVLAAA